MGSTRFVAAIDVGSNAIRLSVVSISPEGTRETVHTAREPVRLGKDVFATGSISAETLDRTLEAFGRLREQIDRYGTVFIRAAATSAVREARNGAALVAAVESRCQIPIAIVGPEEEARLVHLAVKERVNLKNRMALLIDIGGGSVEVSVVGQSGILSSESYAMGSVRLLETLKHDRLGETRFNRMVERCADSIELRLKRELGGRRLDACLGAGGSIESLGALRRDLFGKNNTAKVTAAELDSMVKTLEGMSLEARIRDLRLRPDRADVIVPAAIVLRKIVQIADVEEVAIPGVSLRDGLISEMAGAAAANVARLDYDQIIGSAVQLGRKYSVDEPHARAVANLSLQIFDQTRTEHGLDQESRVLLEVAALLHDIGQFVEPTDHHKHSYYLLHSSSIIGLTPTQMEIAANIARYHRRAMPKAQHRNLDPLSARQRAIVSTLGGILRIANALDRDKAGAVRSVDIAIRKPKAVIKLVGEGDLLLERWAAAARCDLFEEAFGVKLTVEGAESGQ